MKPLFLPTIAMALMLAGCESKPQRAAVTADELLLALRGQVFTVRTPGAVDPDAFAGLALGHPDGTIMPFSSSNGLKPNTELKVILIDPRQGSLRHTILGDGYLQRGEATNFPEFSSYAANPESTNIGIDQALMRFGGRQVSPPSSPLPEGQFDLIFHVQKKDQ